MIKFDLHKEFVSRGKKINIHLNAECEEGRIITVYGKSGAGKTTLLRMLAGLTNPDKGKISIGDELWYDSSKKRNLKINQRHIGFVFQDYSLFPNMNVYKNIMYGVEDKTEKELIDRIIEIAHLSDLLDRKPNSLSGGQQQRVALARAIARKPKLLLLDEPLSALDTGMRRILQEEILSLQKVIKTTIIIVTHHLPEVFKLADEVLLLENGSFTKKGTATEVFMGIKDKKTDLIGEMLSIEEHDDAKIMRILVDGKIVNVNLPNDK